MIGMQNQLTKIYLRTTWPIKWVRSKSTQFHIKKRDSAFDIHPKNSKRKTFRLNTMCLWVSNAEWLVIMIGTDDGSDGVPNHRQCQCCVLFTLDNSWGRQLTVISSSTYQKKATYFHCFIFKYIIVLQCMHLAGCIGEFLNSVALTAGEIIPIVHC